MKTIIFETIDGHDIIRGTGNVTIEPIETNKIVKELLKETPEHQALEAKKAEYMQAAADRLTAIKSKDNAKYKAAGEAMKTAQAAAIPLAKDLKAKIVSLRRENAVYFEPRAGEVVRPDEEVKTLLKVIQGRAQGTFIALDGSVVQDNRGKVYFRKVNGKWGGTRILRLGDKVPADAVLDSDMTDTQIREAERDRVMALPDNVKALEKEKAMGSAINAAADMRSRLEIQSDSDALKKSQKWYRDEAARIEGLYG